MKVLYIGYPKCGTTTMAVAFHKLGYKSYDNPEHFTLLGREWRQIFQEGATPEALRRMYSDVDTAADTPVYEYWEEFLEAFPDLKLIVSYREEESWLKSALNQIEMIAKSRPLQIMSMLSPTAYYYVKTSRMCSNLFWEGTKHHWPWQMYSGLAVNRLLQCYRRHNAYIQQKAPKDQLLVFDFKDGWEPICKFLGKPIPDEPFPHANRAGKILEELNAKHPAFQKMKRESMITLSLLVLLFGLVLYFFVL